MVFTSASPSPISSPRTASPRAASPLTSSPRVLPSKTSSEQLTNTRSQSTDRVVMSTTTSVKSKPEAKKHAQALSGALNNIDPKRSARLMAVLASPNFDSARASPVMRSPTLSRNQSEANVLKKVNEDNVDSNNNDNNDDDNNDDDNDDESSENDNIKRIESTKN